MTGFEGKVFKNKMEHYKIKKNKGKIIMFLDNPFMPDERVLREATTLSGYRFNIEIVAWDRTGKFKTRELYGNIHIYRVSVKSKFGSGIKQVIPLFIFWNKAFLRVMKEKDVNIYHAHDFYNLPLAFFVNLLRKRKLIYDSHENFPEFLKKGNPFWVSKIVEIMERFLLKKVDYVITASDTLRKKFENFGIKNVKTVGNWKSKKLRNVDLKEVYKLKKKFNITKKDFVVVYIGGLNRDRDVVSLIKASEGKKDIKAIIFGRGENQSLIEMLCNKSNNVIYGGWLPLKDVPLCYNMADVIFYALRQDSPLLNFNAPNSLGFSLVFGKPMIAYGKGDLKRVIEETKAGIILKNLNSHTVLNAIYEIKRNYKYYSKNAWDAGEKKYNWDIAKESLLKIYREYL